jgi:hypothetical protein
LKEYLLDILLHPTPITLIVYKQFSSYINNRLVSIINKTIELSPMVISLVGGRTDWLSGWVRANTSGATVDLGGAGGDGAQTAAAGATRPGESIELSCRTMRRAVPQLYIDLDEIC